MPKVVAKDGTWRLNNMKIKGICIDNRGILKQLLAKNLITRFEETNVMATESDHRVIFIVEKDGKELNAEEVNDLIAQLD